MFGEEAQLNVLISCEQWHSRYCYQAKLRNHRTSVSQRGGRTASGTHIVKLTNAKGTGVTQHHCGEGVCQPTCSKSDLFMVPVPCKSKCSNAFRKFSRRRKTACNRNPMKTLRFNTHAKVCFQQAYVNTSEVHLFFAWRAARRVGFKKQRFWLTLLGSHLSIPFTNSKHRYPLGT